MERKKVGQYLKNRLNKIILGLGIIFLLLFLVFNVVSSQIISPLYFSYMIGGKSATVSFLQKIKETKYYMDELKNGVAQYGNTLEKEIDKEEYERNTKINKLEQLLKKNPQSRDVLYSLFLLYHEGGDDSTAQKYLLRVKIVDPSIK